jgi:hypothetical protein
MNSIPRLINILGCSKQKQFLVTYKITIYTKFSQPCSDINFVTLLEVDPCYKQIGLNNLTGQLGQEHILASLCLTVDSVFFAVIELQLPVCTLEVSWLLALALAVHYLVHEPPFVWPAVALPGLPEGAVLR